MGKEKRLYLGVLGLVGLGILIYVLSQGVDPLTHQSLDVFDKAAILGLGIPATIFLLVLSLFGKEKKEWS